MFVVRGGLISWVIVGRGSTVLFSSQGLKILIVGTDCDVLRKVRKVSASQSAVAERNKRGGGGLKIKSDIPGRAVFDLRGLLYCNTLSNTLTRYCSIIFAAKNCWS